MEKSFHAVTPAEFGRNPFSLIGKSWALITAKKDDKVNTMIASWGGMGVLWEKPVVFIFIRKSRYTKEFVDGSDTFSLSFLPHALYQKELGYLGRVSGRDEDKIAKAGLTVLCENGTPYFEESDCVLLCRKLSCTPLPAASILIPEIVRENYANGNEHDLYVGEITAILEK